MAIIHRLISEDFESGDAGSRWDGDIGTPTTESGTILFGDYYGKADAGAGGEYWKHGVELDGDILWLRVYIDDSALSLGGGDSPAVMWGRGTGVGADCGGIYLAAVHPNKVAGYIFDNAGAAHATSFYDFDDGDCIEVFLDWDAADGVVKLYINGVLKETVNSGAACDNRIPDEIRLGIGACGASAGSVYVDNAAADDAAQIGCLTEYGTDVFKIHPDNNSLSTITCTLSKDDTNNFHVVKDSLDFASADREEVMYAEGKRGGWVQGSKQGLVTARFSILCYGDTRTEAIENARSIRRALTDGRGGYIEYKPLGLDTKVMSTWYRYLKSKPPREQFSTVSYERGVIDGRYVLVETESCKPCIRLDCEVTTLAIATSDPEDLITIIHPITLDNRDDATHTNYIDIAPGDVKGDAILPVIQVLGTTDDYRQIILHKRAYYNNTSIDWTEGEDMTDGGAIGAAVVDANRSAGEKYRVNATGDLTVTYSNWDKSYFGRVTPMIAAINNSGVGEEITLKVCVYLATKNAPYQETDEIEVETDHWQVYSFDELDLPPIHYPDFVNDSAGNIDEAMQDLTVCITVGGEFTHGTTNVDIDWIYVPVGNDYLCMFRTTFLSASITNTRAARLDHISSTANIVDKSNDDSIYALVKKYGPPMDDLAFLSGENSRLRFILSDGAYETYVYDSSGTFEACIEGIYMTATPFTDVGK